MRPTAVLPLLVTALAAFAAGCQGGRADPAPSDRPTPLPTTPTRPPAPPPLPSPPPAAPAPRREVPPRADYDLMRLHMHQSFDLLRAIERLLIRGQLEPARRLAAAIAAAPDAPAHGPWAAHTVLVRDRAGALARATTVEDACAREAQLAAACAGCHVELGVAPEFAEHPAAPPDEPTVAARMRRHRWAADRLWEGIVGGAEEPWRAGLDVLAAPPLQWAKLAPGRAAHASKLRQLAANALSNPRLDLDARANAYGELLATCAACHTAAEPPRP